MREKENAKNIIKELELCTEPEANVILTMAQRHLNAIESTSAGRLFDAVSAILGIQKSSTFEGEASMALEFAAEAFLTFSAFLALSGGVFQNRLLLELVEKEL